MKTFIVTLDELNELTSKISRLEEENLALKKEIENLKIKMIARALAERLNSEEGKAAMKRSEQETKKQLEKLRPKTRWYKS